MALGHLRVSKDWQFETASSLLGLPGKKISTAHGLWNCEFPDGAHGSPKPHIIRPVIMTRFIPEASAARVKDCTARCHKGDRSAAGVAASVGYIQRFFHMISSHCFVASQCFHVFPCTSPLNRQPSSACHADYASTDLGR